MQIGSWIVTGENGIWFSPFDETYYFKTKQAAISDVAKAKLDCRRKPRVVRLGTGSYLYTVKNADSKKFEDGYMIIRLTKSNKEKYRRWIEEQESGKDNECLW